MAKDWTPVHDEIKRLYNEEGKPLHEVMRLVKGKFGFIASERSYRTQLKPWGYTKYSTQASPKPAKKKAKPTKQVPQSTRSSHVVPTTNQVESAIAVSSDTLPTSLPDFSSFTGDGMLFSTTHDSSSSGALPAYNGFSIGNHLPISQSLTQSSHTVDGKTPLHDAVIQKDFDSVKSLVFAGHAIDIKDTTGNTPLHWAVLRNDYEIVKLLVDFGADVNLKGQLGRSALHHAVATVADKASEIVSTRVVDLLLKEGAETSSQDDKGDTPLHLAIVEDLKEILDKDLYNPKMPPVIERFLQSRTNLNMRNALGATAFLKLLDISAPSSVAIFQLISLFLKAGASATLALPDGRTPLSMFLHSYSKDRATRTTGSFYAVYASRLKQEECHRTLRHFLDAGASIQTATSSDLPMVLDYFRNKYWRWDADVTLAERLCDLCPPNLEFEEGNTILHELVRKRRPKTAKHCGTAGLIDIAMGKGADVNHQNHRGETPLMIIFTTGQVGTKSYEVSNIAEQVMSTLLHHGADPRAMDAKRRHMVFEAVKMFPKAAPAFLRPLFRAYISIILKGNLDLENSKVPTASAELEWLSKWERVVRKQRWGPARTRMTKDLVAETRAKIDITVVKMAYTALAEHVIQAIMRRYADGLLEKDKARSRVSNILRGCRRRDLPVEMTAYDSLLELC